MNNRRHLLRHIVVSGLMAALMLQPFWPGHAQESESESVPAADELAEQDDEENPDALEGEAEIPAEIVAAPPPAPLLRASALGAFGMHLGIAFQIADDVLDYTSDAEELGKNIGDDLAEGKPTLPLIYAMQRGDAEQKSLLAAAIRDGGIDRIDQVIEIIRSTGALDASIQRARDESKLASEALQALPAGKHRDALNVLAEYAVARLS